MLGLELRDFFVKELAPWYEQREAENVFYLCVDHFTEQTRLEWDMNFLSEHTGDLTQKVSGLLPELKSGKPVQQVLGRVWFYDMQLSVNEHVLIPRPETEELVDWIVDSLLSSDPKSMLDIGTGSGCIALALAQNYPLAQVEGWDVSDKALELATQNAKDLDLDNILFKLNDALDLNDENSASWDVIVSNPPYILPVESSKLSDRVIEHEPELALFVSNDDPLQFYKAISSYALKNLNDNGSLFFECHEDHAQEVADYLSSVGFKQIELREDLQGKQRMIRAQKEISPSSLCRK